MSTYIHYTNLGQRPIADLTAKRLLNKGARLAKKLNKKEDISQSEDKEDDELLKTMRVATAKMNLAKRIKQVRTQQKDRMDTLIKQKAPPERKKQIKVQLRCPKQIGAIPQGRVRVRACQLVRPKKTVRNVFGRPFFDQNDLIIFRPKNLDF